MKKGLSPLISVVLIIGLIVALSSLLFAWGQGLLQFNIKETTKLTAQTTKCYPGIDIAILNVCTFELQGDELIKITIENNMENKLDGDFFLIRVDAKEANDGNVVVPTRPFTNLGAFDREIIEITNPFDDPEKVGRISLIPRLEVEGESVFCTGNVPTYENIKLCSL